MNKAWIAFPLITIALVGCKTSESEPVSQVPPPAYGATASAPEPLAPVSIDQGSQSNPYGASEFGHHSEGHGIGRFEPESLPPATTVSRSYTIQKGDTLWSIAQREYGNGQKWRDISAANASVDPTKLIVGQQITLP